MIESVNRLLVTVATLLTAFCLFVGPALGITFQTTQLTNNSFNDTQPRISGNNIVWQQHDGNDLEIFLYNGTNTIQLTHNNYDDSFPEVSGDNVVWQGDVGGGSSEVFFYDGTTTTRLTNNNHSDRYPKISGDNVV